MSNPNVPQDGTPTYLDDNPNPAATAYTPPGMDTEVPPLEDPAPEPDRSVSPPDAQRNAIAERIRAKRAAENPDVVPVVPGVDLLTPPFVALQQPEPEPEPDPEPETPASTYTLKVNGNTFAVDRAQLLAEAELDEEDARSVPDTALVRIAQRNMAAKNFLDEAKTIAKSARAGRAAEGTPPSHTPAPDELDPQDPPSEIPPADPRPVDPLAAAIEDIQFGDPVEAAQKLRQAMDHDNRARAYAHSRERVETTVAEAINSFEQQNADLLGDPAIGPVVYGHFAYEEILSDLVKIGEAQGVTAEQIRSGIPDLRSAINAYTVGKARGAQLRDPVAILQQTESRARTRFNMPRQGGPSPQPNPAPQTQQPAGGRLEMKRQLSHQPTRTSAAPVPDQQPASDRRSVVNKMRAARGQQVYG